MRVIPKLSRATISLGGALLLSTAVGCADFLEVRNPNVINRAEIDPVQVVERWILARLRDREQEVFCCMFLDNRHRLLAFEELFIGTFNGAAVYPREVVKRALSHNAAAAIFAHNHPSGVAEPSAADRQLTRRLQDALGLIDVRVLDHLVVGDGGTVSFSELGYL